MSEKTLTIIIIGPHENSSETRRSHVGVHNDKSKMATRLIFVQVLVENALGHVIRDEGVTPEGGDVRPTDGLHLGEEAVHEAVQPPLLAAGGQEGELEGAETPQRTSYGTSRSSFEKSIKQHYRKFIPI